VPHPNADALRICRVDIGGGEIKEIVCGGTNLENGMKVLVACPGAMVRWHGEGDLVEIKNAKLRGVASFGMICASVEVGLADLFPVSDTHEIMDLSYLDVPAGTPVAKALDLDDMILEIDNKSMTNRPDLWGHYGIARELAALYDLPLVEFTPYTPDTDVSYDVRIVDGEKCPRYTEDDGATWTELDADTIVSMNMWGFHKSYLTEAEARFPAFLDEAAKTNPLKGEYFLPAVVSQLLDENKARVRVLSSTDKWYGVTYKEDKPVVVNALAGMREAGLYPAKLWK
jgi:tRNA-binding EMAP/Myf-like protein